MVGSTRTGNDRFQKAQQVANTTVARPWSTTDLEDNDAFSKVFVLQKTLGRGGEGVVNAYRHQPSGDVVAVKVSIDHKGISKIKTEASNLRMVGTHDHIVEMLTYSGSHRPLGPAIFLRLADLGSLICYRDAWCEQERLRGRPKRPAESTIWKLLKDMILALDHLHNGLHITYIHNDIKPENILVLTPEGHDWGAAGLPTEPIFQLADFTRLVPFPAPAGTIDEWAGTPEYAPPPSEQRGHVKPCTDIWGLGGTVQYFALGCGPQQSRAAFMADRKKQGLDHPALDDQRAWKMLEWRRARPVVYRPLNAPVEYYARVPFIRDYQPYSSNLNAVYASLMELNADRRPTSRRLVEYIVPSLDKQIKMAKTWR
tara:strand:+ start:2117 stop:3226 length:1110 start_codon:yes stop_codon:yes gene_type:complete